MDTYSHATARWGSPSVSIAQHWLLQAARLRPAAPIHTTIAIELIGELFRPSLRLALDDLVARHPLLRTVFRYVDGVPLSEVGPVDRGMALWEQDIRGDEEFLSILHEEVRAHFDVTSGPVIRARLLRRGTHQHFLLISAHPIVCDRASLVVILRELWDRYEDSKLGRNAQPMVRERVERRQFDALDPSSLQAQLSFWKTHLLGAQDLVRLPTDRPRSACTIYTPRTHRFEISERLTRDIYDLATHRRVSVLAVLLGGWCVLLSRWSAQDDVTIGQVVANRPLEGGDSLIGPFENVLPIRVAVAPAITTATLLAKIDAALTMASSRRDVPIQAIAESLRALRDGRPIVQTAIALSEISSEEFVGVTFPSIGIGVGRVWQERCECTLEISLALWPHRGRLIAVCEYAKELFQKGTIERVCHWWIALFEAMTRTPRTNVARLTMLTPSEHRLVISEFNNGEGRRLEPLLIDAMFESQVELSPNAPAVTSAGGSEVLSYLELNQRANQLARVLRCRGMRRGEMIGVPADPSVTGIVAVIAVLKAGGAYRAATPTDLRDGTIRSRGAHGLRMCIVCPGAGRAGEQVIVIDPDVHEISTESQENLERGDRTVFDPACVVKRDDSKGGGRWMRLDHGNITSMVAALDERLHFARFDVWSLTHSLSSHVALIELWGGLLHGSPVTVAAGPIRDARSFDDFLAHTGITVSNLTPREFLVWVDVADHARRYPLHTVILSGGPLRAARLKTWFDMGRRWPRIIYLCGHRGITVASALSTIKLADAVRVSRGLLGGEPLSCCRLYILDRYRRPVPIGVVGDLYVAGYGVARSRRAARKLACRESMLLAENDNSLLFKTGDRGYWTPEGQFELVFYSRVNAQWETEAVRIESELLSHPSVKFASVALRRNETGGDSYVAYVEGEHEVPVPSQLRAYLESSMPGYMVPTVFICSESGKEFSEGFQSPD
ncbi:condensation domain-containing protein [Peristeroidobacter soli]|uniref:condensation domain-containing protein n=1 Tax=Peristeroidobacter soli TaxID=2497877 RepID=UPI00158A3491|nr:condensation domain-containing protein [Peristeroidobacter soli]